jgi:lysozyme family protein
MRHVIRDAFRRVENGYEGASQKLKYSMLMAAVIDTIYRDGPSKGTALIQEAIRAGDTQGRYTGEGFVDGVLGTGTINALEAVMKTEEGRRNFWAKYSELRNNAHKEDEKDRVNRVIPPQYRTN